MENSVTSFENLYRAYKIAKRNKSKGTSSLIYELNAVENTVALQRQLESRTYRPKPTFTFTVHEPKERIVESNAFSDKVVQHSLCDNAIMPYFQKSFIRDNYASQIGKGQTDALDRLAHFMRHYYFSRKANADKAQRGAGGYEKGYVLKGDFAHYFYSIQHEPLKAAAHAQIAKQEPDSEMRDFCCWLLDVFVDSTANPGIPIGFQTSQPLAILNLNAMDHHIQDALGATMYGRYMDDFYIIHEDKAQLQEWLADIRAFIQPLGLSLNNKTQIFPLSQGLDFLGFHTYITPTGKIVRKLRSNKKADERRKLKKLRRMLDDGEITAKKIEESYQSWRSHVKQGDTHRLLRNMDALYNTLFPENQKKRDDNGKKNKHTRNGHKG